MTALRAYRGLLGNGPLARLLAGEFVSGIGDWLYLVALLIVVYQHNQDAVLLGIVGAARVLPYVLLSIPAGLAADRFDRRTILIVTDTARAAIMVAIAWLVAANGPVEAIVGLAILATCFSTFFGPTIGAFIPTLVRDERELGPANSAWASLDNLAYVIGPVLAGVLVAAGGLSLAFLLNAISFIAVDVILWRLPSPKPAAIPDTAHQSEAAGSPSDTDHPAPRDDAASTNDERAPIRALVGLSLIDVVGSFAFGGVGVLTVYLATKTFGAGDAGTGYLNGAIGVGGLVGAVVSGAFVLRPRLGPMLVVGAVVAGAGLVGLGLAGGLGFALLALTAAAAGSLVLEVVSTTVFQRAVPDRLRGRALGFMATASSLAYAGGALLLPVLSDGWGVTPVLVGAGLAVIVAAIGGRLLVGNVATRSASPYDATLARIAALPLFAGVSAARLEGALRQFRPVGFAGGEVVIREGDPADSFYVLVEGQVLVSQRAHDRTDRVLRTMGPDEVFGEIGLLRTSPRTATVTTLGPVRLLALGRDEFLALVAADTRIGSRLLDLHRGSTAAELRAESEVSPT